MNGCYGLSQACLITLSAVLFLVQCKYEYLIPRDHPVEEFCKDVICKNVVCEEIKNCSGVIVPRATFCWCCPACVSYSDIGSSCTENQDSLTKLSSKCKNGLTCLDGKCTIDFEGNRKNCLVQRQLRNEKRGLKHYAQDLWVPECDKDGEYQARQIKGRRNICFDGSGSKLFGTSAQAFQNACTCSRHMQTLFSQNLISRNIHPQEHCSLSGSFEKLQCQKHLCYCANEDDGQVIGKIVRIDNLRKLPCAEDAAPEGKYLRPCEEEFQRSQHLAYELYLKGVEIIGQQNVKCDPDGTFAPKQCQPDRCVCTDPDGVGIGSYAIEMGDLQKLSPVEMLCNCARERISAKNFYLCKGYGNYAEVQCFNSEQCYCVDEDGEILTKNLSKTVANEECQNLLKNMLELPDDLQTTPDTSMLTDDDYYNDEEF